jgi:hypothetical protein
VHHLDPGDGVQVMRAQRYAVPLGVRAHLRNEVLGLRGVAHPGFHEGQVVEYLQRQLMVAIRGGQREGFPEARLIG